MTVCKEMVVDIVSFEIYAYKHIISYSVCYKYLCIPYNLNLILFKLRLAFNVADQILNNSEREKIAKQKYPQRLQNISKIFT